MTKPRLPGHLGIAMSTAHGADGFVLCQDCGHVEPFTAERHRNVEACQVCSGDFCGCDSCNELARLAVQFQGPDAGGVSA